MPGARKIAVNATNVLSRPGRRRRRLPDVAGSRTRGVKMGRPLNMTPHQIKEALHWRHAGEPHHEIARSYNGSHNMISWLGHDPRAALTDILGKIRSRAKVRNEDVPFSAK
jgi:hypothetical protein